MKIWSETHKIYWIKGLSTLSIILLYSCYPDESLDIPAAPDVQVESNLDIYIDQNFVQEYDMAIRYKFEDRFIQPFQRVSPVALEAVRPMPDFIEDFWVGPYSEVENGEEFFRTHVPVEIVFLGGLIFNEDGTVTLGTADAGVQITFTNVNAIDRNDPDWVEQQLGTVYHEFAHIVHQRYKLPQAFETISPQGYTSQGSWFNLTDQEALQRGFVSPYATSSPNEDFAETVAFYLFDTDFETFYLSDEPNCVDAECAARNEGRERIRQKLSSIEAHYEKFTGVVLAEVRARVQSRL
jgi:substrate import-associated zinc metallohydrolase lipoprotein